jgi:hypothetical protein
MESETIIYLYYALVFVLVVGLSIFAVKSHRQNIRERIKTKIAQAEKDEVMKHNKVLSDLHESDKRIIAYYRKELD